MIFFSDGSPDESYAVTSNHHQNVEGGTSIQYKKKLVDDYDPLDLESGVYTFPRSGYDVLHFFRYTVG